MLARAATVSGHSVTGILILVSMPVVAALIGYSTKRALIRMIFEPIEFKGVGPFGWQGIVPRRAAKMANVAYATLTNELLDPAEMLGQLDPAQLAARLDEPLRQAVDNIAEELAAELDPDLWLNLPPSVRLAVLNRVRARAPQLVASVLASVRSEVNDVFDLRWIVVSNLVRDKPALNSLFRNAADNELRFIRRSGAYFGALIGVLQATIWALTHEDLVMPIFGLFTGLVTDFLALQMIFRPIEPKRYLGIVRWQGLFHRRREAISAAYAELIAKDVLTPRVLIEGVLNGPTADRLFAIVRKEILLAIDAEVSLARPLVSLAVGTTRYTEMKRRVAQHVIEILPAHSHHVEQYAEETFGLRTMLGSKMLQLSSLAYEGILRPIFKEDEKTVIAVGAILGFLVGELQVQIVTRL